MAGRTVTLFANLVSAPFTIRLLGPTRFGLWSLLQSFYAWAVVADIGMSSASTKFASERYAHGDAVGESTVVWTAVAITGVCTSALVLAVALAAPYLLGHLLHVRDGLLTPGVVAVRVVCLLFVAQALSNTLNTPQLVRLRWRSYSLIANGAGVFLALGTPIAVAMVGGGVETASIVGLVSVACGALANLVLALRLQPALLHPHLDKATFKRLLSYGGALTVAGMAGVLLPTVQRLFLAHNHSTAAVAYYSVAVTVGTTLYVVPEALVAPLLPGLTRLAAEGRTGEHAALYRKCLSGLFLLATPAAIMLAFLGQPFLSLWAGAIYGAHSTGPLVVILVGAWSNALASAPLSYLLSSGRTKLIAYIQVGVLPPYVVAAYFFTQHLAAVGGALAWSGTLMVQSIALFVATRKVAPQLAMSPLSTRWVPSLAFPLALASALAMIALTTERLVSRLAWVVVLGLVYLVVTWRLGLTPRERDGMASLAAEAFRRTRGVRADAAAVSAVAAAR